MTGRKHIVRRTVAMLAAALLLVFAPPALVSDTVQAASQSDYDKLKAAQEALKKEQEALKKQIAEAGESVEEQQKKLTAIKRQISVVEAQIENCDEHLALLNADIDRKDDAMAARSAEIDQTEQNLNDRFETLRRRLNSLVKTGNMSALQMLFDGDEYTDYLLKSKLIRTISEKDEAMMQQLTRQIEEIHRQKDLLQTERDELSGYKREYEQLKAENDAKKEELDALYVSAKKVETQLKKQLGEYEAYQKQLAKEAEDLEKDIQRILKELEQQNTGRYNGTMLWPVPTVLRISSYYGTRWGKLHKGIDIANGKALGEKIYPAADGTVIYANYTREWGGGYGYYCMVSHGKDSQGREIVTLYAHMKILYARLGDTVKAGQTVLGLIGSTGDSTGPHLHFEVRENGTPVDPIAKGYVKDANKL
ncbi:MAG: peptidoglycan DD-metalloendopeptidase family protein [Clostridia bacterium]|nr:peptidoglycan DD-metalloendopeptidase family protein [Clostridia bacterium]